jgi:3-hydroxybutyryl-CoA dehydrogenase
MQLQKIGVVGLGLLGRGIATCLLAHNFRVIACDLNPDTRADARAHIDRAIEELVHRGGMPASLLTARSANYTETAAIPDLARCDFVIESVFENLDAKRAVFDQLESAVSPTTPIASNTSAIPITLLQHNRRHPGRFVGMHWAEPCHLTRFLEVIRGDHTTDAAAEAAIALGKRAAKDPSLVRKDVEGFIVNRIGYAMYREAFWLLENGVADVETIDRSFRNAMSVWANVAGPFRWMDLTGVPAYAAVMKRLWPKLSTATEVPKAMRDVVDSGGKGIANGHGFYNYTPEEAREWERRLRENVWTVRDLTARLFPDEETQS